MTGMVRVGLGRRWRARMGPRMGPRVQGMGGRLGVGFVAQAGEWVGKGVLGCILRVRGLRVLGRLGARRLMACFGRFWVVVLEAPRTGWAVLSLVLLSDLWVRRVAPRLTRLFVLPLGMLPAAQLFSPLPSAFVDLKISVE